MFVEALKAQIKTVSWPMFEKAFSVREKLSRYKALDELKKTGWTIGGENSGHIVNLNLTTTGDGIISALQVLHALCSEEKSLAELKTRMHKFPQILINVPVNKPIKINEQPGIQSAMQAAEKRLGNKGRLLIRASGTEPVIRVMVEGEDKDLVNTMAQELAQTIQKQAA